MNGPLPHPTHSRIRANGLTHHVITWEPEGPRPEATVLCAHGFLDMGLSFRGIAEALVRRGHRVVAFDWRGHGQTDWIGPGGYYHFFDYVADLADLVDALVPGKLHLVGHSMGGTAASLYAGTFPERVEKLVLLEGLGPAEPPPQQGPERMARWVSQVRRIRSGERRIMHSLPEAVERMRVQNPGLDDELGFELARHSTTRVEGGWVWSFDPLHRTRGPYPFRTDGFVEFLSALTMPTLCIDGEEGYRAPDQQRRRDALPNARFLELPGVGHMLHWFAPAATAEAIHGFLTTPPASPIRGPAPEGG